MTRRRGRPLLVVIAAAVAVGCSGCAGGSNPMAKEPPPLASLLASPASSTSPRAAAVEKAVRAYLDALNVASRTGDTKPALRLTTVACKCRAELTRIANLYAHHGRYVGSRIDVTAVDPATVLASSARATVTYDTPASRVVTPAGRSRSVPAHKNQTLQVTLQRKASTWLVSAVTVPKTGASPSPR